MNRLNAPVTGRSFRGTSSGDQAGMTPGESRLQGLSGQEARRKLEEHGYNELPSKQPRTLPHLAFEVMREPMFLLLIVAGLVYLALGDAGDAAMLLGFVFIVMAITIFQERKTERVLESLRDLSSPRALVIRDGAQVRIPGREVALEDLLVLEEGDRVAADGALLECHDLLIDESLGTLDKNDIRLLSIIGLKPPALAGLL